MSETEKSDDCEFVGARMVRYLKGQEKENLVQAEESNIHVSGTGHGTHDTVHEKKETGPARSVQNSWKKFYQDFSIGFLMTNKTSIRFMVY